MVIGQTEIYRPVVASRGDLRMVSQNFEQSVIMTGGGTLGLVADTKKPDTMNKITGNIIPEVFSKNRYRVFCTAQYEIKGSWAIVLKTRYGNYQTKQ